MSNEKRHGRREATATDETFISPWSPFWSVTGGATLAALIAIMFAKPVVDSDLWYHLAYARQMVAGSTLVLDHTSFSWTPTDNTIIYCAWLTQLGFYGVFQAAGLPALFALRYLVVVLVFGLGLGYAYRVGALRHPLTLFSACLACAMSSGVVFIKPQLASYALMMATVVMCAMVRREVVWAQRYVFALPLLMLVWVNAHGGFVMGLVYLAAVAAGEMANVYLSPAEALQPTARRRLLLAIALSAAAVVCTPYGLAYPWQFFEVELSAIDLSAVRDYDSIFMPTQRPLHYVEYGAIAIALLATLSWHRLRRGAIEWSLVLTNVLFAGFYAYYVRLTFFWAPIVLISVVTLLTDRVGRTTLVSRARGGVLRSAVFAATLTLSAHAAWADWSRPVIGSWTGFGNGYWNPEEEAQYIGRHFPQERIGNDYNAGGYLIWALGPQSKVFMDARYFPYRAWFQEYVSLESTVGIDALLQKHQADIWCIDLLLPKTVSWFRSSSEWKPAFYGPSAAVFVRQNAALPGGRLQAGNSIAAIRNLYQALVVFAFALDVRDIDGAERVVAGMERQFDSRNDRAVVEGARAAVDGVKAAIGGEHALAVRLLSPVASAYQGLPAAALANSATRETLRLWGAGDLESALQMAELAARVDPQSVAARYNAGAIGWWAQHQAPGLGDLTWRTNLEAAIQLATANRAGNDAVIGFAREMLSSSTTVRPQLLAPGP